MLTFNEKELEAMSIAPKTYTEIKQFFVLPPTTVFATGSERLTVWMFRDLVQELLAEPKKFNSVRFNILEPELLIGEHNSLYHRIYEILESGYPAAASLSGKIVLCTWKIINVWLDIDGKKLEKEMLVLKNRDTNLCNMFYV